MAIIKWEPFRDIERFFDDELPQFSLPRIGWDLAVDVYEDGGNVVAEMQIPGIDPSQVEVSVENNHLVVSGTRQEEQEKKDKHFYSKEIRRGSFQRTIKLPAPVMAEKSSAEYKDGVLQVTIPKKDESSGKIKVDVKK